MTRSNTIIEAQQYVTELLSTRLAPHCTYHNVEHTLAVYHAAMELAKKSDVPDNKTDELALAALFHDVGYIEGAEDHESRSANMAEEWLSDRDYSLEAIESVKDLIRSTKMGASAHNISQHILRDADMQHLAQEHYINRSLALKTEMEAEKQLGAMTHQEWVNKNIAFFETHQYESPAGIATYQEGKSRNLALLKNEKAPHKKKNKKKPKKKSTISSNKAASMQFKTALRNHIDLSSIADNKANMMLSVNALILTISIPAIGVQLADRPRLLVPFALLLVTCILSIIFATLATKPIKMSGLTALTDIESGQANLFFFGNFFKMPRRDYERGISMILKDETRLESAIVMDLYHLGKALGGKYRYLRICYNLFMYGLISTTLSFLAIMLTYIWG